MKQAEDKFTIDAFGKRGRGRPRKPDAKSSAQRVREFRARKKFDFLQAQACNENSPACNGNSSTEENA